MTHDTTIMFVHGLWLAAQSWRPWQEHFEQYGWTTLAPGYPGEGHSIGETRSNPDAQAGYGIDDLVDHFCDAARAVDGPVIAIGHSMGGLVAEKMLGENAVVAAIAIDPAPIKGVKPLPFAQLRSAFPVLSNPANKRKAKALNAKQFRYAFGNALTQEESDELWERWSIPSPGRPLFEAASANLTRHSPAAVATDNDDRGPLLIMSGGADHTVPDKVTRAAYMLYAHSAASTELQQFEGKGHSLTIDHGWKEVADGCLLWLDGKGLAR